MKRLGGITFIATLSLLGSLLLVALGIFMLLVFLTHPPSTADVPMGKILIPMTIVVYLLPAAWGITTAIGMYRLKRWARVSTLIFSGLLIFFGLVTPAVFLLIPLPATPNADAAVMSGVKIAISIFYLTLAAIGAWWMVYLTRARVKEQFGGEGTAEGSPSRRPLSISIIAWLMIVGACFVPLNLAMHMPMLAFGTLLTGWKASLFLIVFAAMALGGGVGLLRLEPYGLKLGIVYFGFGILNGAVSYFMPGMNERYAEMLNAMPSYLHTPTPPPFNPMVFMVIMIPVMLIPIYFLVKNKAAFTPPPPVVA